MVTSNNEAYDLDQMKDDDDTLVIDKDVTIGKMMEEPGTVDANPARRGSRRMLCTIAWIMAVLSGTFTGVAGAVTAAAGRLSAVDGYTHGDTNWFITLPWAGEVSGEHVQADYMSRGLMWIALAGIIFLASVTVLCVLSGRFAREEDGSIHLSWLDRIWTEIQLVIAVCAATGAVWLVYPIWMIAPLMGWYSFFEPYTPNAYYYEMSNDFVIRICVAGMAACIALATLLLVSMVKKIKARKLIEKSLLGIILGWLGVGAKYAGHGAARAGKGFGSAIRSAGREIKEATRGFAVPADTDRRAVIKIMARYIMIALALIFIPDLVGGMTSSIGVILFCQIVAAAIAVMLIIRKISTLTDIRAGVIEVKSGNLGYKIPVREDDKGPKTDLDKLAKDINHISEATNAAVQNEIKNQRLKTDLISNVSHDLKTPLTSMISYLDILEKEGLDSPDAPSHLAIVQEKTARLKTLTEDLFEAAKASSGNIPCEITDIDIRSLIDQSLAEMDDRLRKRKLKIKKNYKTDCTMVRADGKLLGRVFENLLGNISKYALDRSRVYIDVTDYAGANTLDRAANTSMPAAAAADHTGKLLIEIKNISRDELNISADELMERFTRGDSSRNTEGSGLGLAIAKDLTQLMGGTFRISIDGDMFKASILLNQT